MKKIKKFASKSTTEVGQGLTEVALFLLLVVVVVMVVLPALGVQISSTFTSVTSALGG